MVLWLFHRDNDLSALVASAPSQHPHPGEYMDEGKNNSSLNTFPQIIPDLVTNLLLLI
jgi:hypothetical protein